MKTKLITVSLAIALLAAAIVPPPLGAQTLRLKDITRVQGVTNNQLVGYGLVVGLQNTGDSQTAVFTSKMLQNILQTFGLSTVSTDVRTRNVAAVMVTAS